MPRMKLLLTEKVTIVFEIRKKYFLYKVVVRGVIINIIRVHD